MHALMTTSAFALAFAVSGCAPASKTTEADAPPAPPAPGAATVQTTTANASEPALASRPMGKRAAPQPGERVSPVIAFKGGAASWSIEIINTDGYDHRVDLTWDNSGKRGEGVLTFQPAADGSVERKVLHGRLNANGDGKDIAIELLAQPCSGDDGVAHDHVISVTVSGMAPMRGCGDLAI